MSCFSYISFPRPIDTSLINDAYDVSALKVGLFLNPIRWGETFQHCFFNNFIYEFSGYLFPTDYKWSAEWDDELLTSCEKQDKEFMQSYCEMKNDEEAMYNWLRMRKRYYYSGILGREQLYEIVHSNLRNGEMVEMYSEWGNHVDFKFGPPKQTVQLDSREIMTSNLLLQDEKIKIEIQYTQ